MKLSKILSILIKITIGISLVYIATGVIIKITRTYFFPNSFYTGIALFFFGLSLHLMMRIYLNYKAKKSIVLPAIFLVTLIVFLITMYTILDAMFTASMV